MVDVILVGGACASAKSVIPTGLLPTSCIMMKGDEKKPRWHSLSGCIGLLSLCCVPVVLEKGGIHDASSMTKPGDLQLSATSFYAWLGGRKRGGWQAGWGGTVQNLVCGTRKKGTAAAAASEKPGCVYIQKLHVKKIPCQVRA